MRKLFPPLISKWKPSPNCFDLCWAFTSMYCQAKPLVWGQLYSRESLLSTVDFLVLTIENTYSTKQSYWGSQLYCAFPSVRVPCLFSWIDKLQLSFCPERSSIKGVFVLMSKAIRSKVWHHKKFQDLQIDRWWNVGQIHFAKRSLFDLLQNDPIGFDCHRRLPLFHLKKQSYLYWLNTEV